MTREQTKELFRQVFEKSAPAIYTILKKYDGKRCGEKTRAKISKELNEIINCDMHEFGWGDKCEFEFNRHWEWALNKKGYKELAMPASILVAIYEFLENNHYRCKAFSIYVKDENEKDSILNDNNILIAPKSPQDLYLGKWAYDADKQIKAEATVC